MLGSFRSSLATLSLHFLPTALERDVRFVLSSWENNSVISIRKMIYRGQFRFRIGPPPPTKKSVLQPDGAISFAKPFSANAVAITLALNGITDTSLIPAVTLSGNTQW